MKREELKTYTSCELYDKNSDELKVGEAFLKEEADKVMDTMERRIKELESDLKTMEVSYEALIKNAVNIAKDTELKLRNRIKELEEENKHLEDYIDVYQKSEALNIEKLDKKDERIKELEAEVEMDAKKRRIMIDGYNRKCERVKELEAQCTKYQAELMNNDPALNYAPPTTEDSSGVEKEK